MKGLKIYLLIIFILVIQGLLSQKCKDNQKVMKCGETKICCPVNCTRAILDVNRICTCKYDSH